MRPESSKVWIDQGWGWGRLKRGENWAYLGLLEIVDLVELALEHAREVALVGIRPAARGRPSLDKGV